MSNVIKYDFKKLRNARERRLMTQTELAKLADVSVTTVCQVEAGKAPWIKAIRRIAAALDVKGVVQANRETTRKDHSSTTA